MEEIGLFYLGESFLYRGLPEAIRYARHECGYPCVFLTACCFDHDGRFNMGDLTRERFMQAWHSEPFQALRRANLAEEVCGTACEKCIAYDDATTAGSSPARAPA